MVMIDVLFLLTGNNHAQAPHDTGEEPLRRYDAATKACHDF